MPEMSETVRQDEAFIMKGRLAVILAADVAGGRRLISEDENGTGRAIRDLHARWSFKGGPQHQSGSSVGGRPLLVARKSSPPIPDPLWRRVLR